MQLPAPSARKIFSKELSSQLEEEHSRLKEAAARVQKEIEAYCPSVHYPVHGTYCWKSMEIETQEPVS